MKDLTALKEEHSELKKKLLELVEFINSEEYYVLSPSEQDLISQQRSGMEMYISALTKRLYGKQDALGNGNSLWPILLYGMFSSSWSSGPSTTSSLLNEFDVKEIKEENNEPGCSN